VDPQSKLVRQAKLWRNLDRAGAPEFDAQTIVYNPEVPQGLFEFQIPPGATVISEEDGEATQALFEQAEQLFKDKKYAEAIGYYQRVHDRYPLIGWGSTSLMMVGICYTHLGDNAKAIECYQQALREFPRGWEGVIQFYLGAAYLDNGQTQEALAAFEACLADADGKRGPVKEAREGIARIKGK
jgi:TolA-binding protein